MSYGKISFTWFKTSVFVVKLTRSLLSNLINSKIVCLLWELFANNLLKNFSYNFGSTCLANGELDNSKQFNDTVRNASSDKLLNEDTQLMNSHSPLEDGHLELADSVHYYRLFLLFWKDFQCFRTDSMLPEWWWTYLWVVESVC